MSKKTNFKIIETNPIDKLIIHAKISDKECAFLAQLHHLQVCPNEEGTQVEYRSSEYSKISGIDVKIQRNMVTLKTSLHKYWNNRNYGRLRNDNIFTVNDSKLAFEMLLFENGLNKSIIKTEEDKQTRTNQPVTYTLFGKTVEPGTLLYSLCDKYYAKLGLLEKDIETENDNERRNLMRNIEEGVWFCEFRTEDVNLRREVMLENFYTTIEELPI